MAGLFVKDSVAGLFVKDSKHLKPQLFLAFALGSEAVDCVGALTACSFEESDTFLTHRFTQSYLETNNLPDLTSYLLIDTISATKKPAGLLLLLRAYITAQS